LRGQLEDQFLAYGWQARRTAEQGATWPEALFDHPLGAFSALLSYRPDEEIPAEVLASAQARGYDPQGWSMMSMTVGGGRHYYDVSYREWLYSALISFVSPDRTAQWLRQRLHGPAFVAPDLAVPSTSKFELWPAGLFAWLAYGFQGHSWWTILDKTGQPPPASFFEEHGVHEQDQDRHEGSLDEAEVNPKRRRDLAAAGEHVFQALWELLEDADTAPRPFGDQMAPGPEGP
jgi:hypothetical protein